MKSGESVLDYFSRTMAIANKMRIHGDQIQDVIIESKDIDELSVDELQSSLQVHEQKLNRSTTEEQALKVSTNGESSATKGSG
ncbi:hypothetical protein CsSME_00002614 [Camellia sinensis var. sinensis]